MENIIGFVRKWIYENKDKFFDEIDLDFIEIVINYMEDV